MIDYFYCGDYPSVRAQYIASPDDDTPLLDAGIYLIADELFVDTLKDSARNEVEKRLNESWNSDVFIHAVNTLWDSYEYQSLYGIIEQVIARHLGGLLPIADAEALISRVLTEGVFSLNFLYQVLNDKNTQIRAKVSELALVKTQSNMLKTQNDVLKAAIKSCHEKITTAQESIGGKELLRNNTKLYRYYRAMEEIEEDLGPFV